MRGQRKEEDIFIIHKSSLRTSLEVGKFTMNPHVRLLVGRLAGWLVGPSVIIS